MDPNGGAVPIRTYTKNHPPLTPLASNQNEEYIAAGILAGEPIRDEHIVDASMQHYTRKGCMKVNRATPVEVAVSKKRKTAVLLDSIGMLPAGQEWVQALTREVQGMNERFTREMQGMNQNQQALTLEVQGMNERFTRVDDRLTRMNVSLKELLVQTSQNTNSTRDADEDIAPVPNGNGEIPNHDFFPASEMAIVSMGVQQVDALLEFYGHLPGHQDDLNIKKSLLCKCLGLKRLAKTFRPRRN